MSSEHKDTPQEAEVAWEAKLKKLKGKLAAKFQDDNVAREHLRDVGLPYVNDATYALVAARLNIDGSYEKSPVIHGGDRKEVTHPYQQRAIIAHGVYQRLGAFEQPYVASEEGKPSLSDRIGDWVEGSFAEEYEKHSGGIGAAVVLLAFETQVPGFFDALEKVPSEDWDESFKKRTLPSPEIAKSYAKRARWAGEIPQYQQNLKDLIDGGNSYLHSADLSIATTRGAEGMYSILDDMWGSIETHLPAIPEVL